MESALHAIQEGVSQKDYLEGEGMEKGRHEYLGGYVYPVEAATPHHNIVSGNLFAALKNALTGSDCRPFVSAVMVQVMVEEDTYFYYPDVVVSCEPAEFRDAYLKSPKVVAEVVSPSTSRVDYREKWHFYRHNPAIEEILLLEQSRPTGKLIRRKEGWKPIALSGEMTLEFHSLGFPLPMSAIYDGIDFTPSAVT